MRTRIGAIVWFIVGGLAAFGFFGAIGMGALFVLPVLFATLVLLTVRLPGIWMAPVGAGVVGGLGWTVHITSGDTPDDQLWPIFVGAGLVVIGVLQWRRAPHLPAAAPSEQG